jgi:hypothetical protein
METTTYSAPAGRATDTETTASTVVITDDGAGALTIVRTPNSGAPVCTLHTHLNSDGMTTTDPSNQTCITHTGNMVTYTMETRVLASGGNSYTVHSTWTVQGKTTSGASLMGNGSGSSNCAKI